MDDRARVPFALLGVVLLVSSATLAATIQPTRSPTDSDSEAVVERATATTQTALREAVSSASRAAAANPVIEPANTTAGRALNDSTAFRDALRVRIYLAARDRLANVAVQQDDVTGTVSLPPVSTAEQLGAAKQRVRIERADANGTAIRVTIRNVTLRTHRDGTIVGSRSLSPTVVVATPVLAAHDRVSTYQQRLNAGITKPGLSQRLNAQLYALAWSRGYLQYGGVPLDNVVSNQHVSVIANQALLSLQRATIGHSDPRGRRTLRVAAAMAATRDLTKATARDTRITEALLAGPTSPTDSEIQGLNPPRRSGPGEQRRIGVNGTADEALLDLLDNGTIEAAARSAYTIRARTISRVEGDRQVDIQPPPRPGENWTRVEQRRNRTVRTRNVDADPPTVPDGWHSFETDSRQTVVSERIVRVWERRVEGENGSVAVERRTTNNTGRSRETVVIAVIGRHDGPSRAPDRPIDDAHERGAGPLDGPNLADARSAATARLVEPTDRRERLLEQAANERLDTNVALHLDRPANISEWIYRDLMALRERVRDLHITAEQSGLGTYRVNPPAELADRLAERRARLLAAPAAYDSAATKARIAARAAYLDRVEDRLRNRAADRRERATAFGQTLENAGTSMTRLTEGLEARERPRPERQPRVSGVGGTLRLTADGAPAYLTRAELRHEQVPAIDNRSHPLVTRNVNLFSVPYQTASDTAVDYIFGTRSRVQLQTAARTLDATNATLRGLNGSGVFDPKGRVNRSNATHRRRLALANRVSSLRQRQHVLRRGVASANAHVIDGQRAVLAENYIGADEAARTAIVQRALSPWQTVHGRALALANGSVSRRVAAIATRRADLSVTARDRLALRLNASRKQDLTEDAARPPTDSVNKSRSMTQKVTRGLAREVVAPAAERATRRAYKKAMQRSFSAMPSGLPLAPVPGSWYVTTNVWHVTVKGEYARFGVRASQGRPSTPGSEFSYARDGSTVTLDVNGDGEADRLGRSTRVDFNASATVLVVVPPGSTGVGDTNGVTVEQSAGWPKPGPE